MSHLPPNNDGSEPEGLSTTVLIGLVVLALVAAGLLGAALFIGQSVG